MTPKQIALVQRSFTRIAPNATAFAAEFYDRGSSYTTAIFSADESQRRLAEASKEGLERAGILSATVVTTIEPAGPFYPAEGYHQDYYTKNPVRYKFYRFSCGRDSRVKNLWGTEAHQGIAKN